jgi:hypothetical protein
MEERTAFVMRYITWLLLQPGMACPDFAPKKNGGEHRVCNAIYHVAAAPAWYGLPRLRSEKDHEVFNSFGSDLN